MMNGVNDSTEDDVKDVNVGGDGDECCKFADDDKDVEDNIEVFDIEGCAGFLILRAVLVSLMIMIVMGMLMKAASFLMMVMMRTMM